MKQNMMTPEQMAEYEPEEPLEVFQASEEIITKKVKKSVPNEELDKRQHYPDSDALNAPEKEFTTLDDLLDEDLSYVHDISNENTEREDSKQEFHKDIDPSFMPTPYNTAFDYKEEDGFFQDITGAPIIVASQMVPVSDNAIQKAFDDQKEELAKAQASSNQPVELATAPMQSAPMASSAMPAPGAMQSAAGSAPISLEGTTPQQPVGGGASPMGSFVMQQQPPPPPQRRSLKQPVRLTYDFRNLFHSKYYWKYRDMLNHAATLVAEKKLDEALEYYYVIQDQNIPSSFRLMIQQNIRDIEQTITDTFRFSDTIVKMNDTGEVSRIRVVEEEELVKEEYEFDGDHRAVRTSEVAFHQTD